VRAILHDGGELVWGEAPEPAPQPGEVLIEVASTSVNRADLLQAAGRYPPPPGASSILGLEAAGTVKQGAGRWKPGDQVMALLAGGGYAERVAAPAEHCLPVPAAVGLQAAGGLMEVFLTAFLNLAELGGLQAGERVLIHGGSGGVGTAAIQLAKLLGAEVWTTASAPKLAACQALGADRALDYRASDFAAELEAAGGADLVLDCLGARYLAPNLRALAPDGRLVVIGLQGGVRGELDLLALLTKRLRVQGSTLRALPRARKAALIERFEARVLPAFAAGDLRVVVDRTIPLSDASLGHRALAEGQAVGKVLLLHV
jgi:putative PIG3 family NAD(P)H quinone oxidoreductase